MIPLCFQTADPLSSQIAWPELHVAHDGPVRSWERQEENSGVEYNVPFHEESCRSSCIYSGPLHSCSFDTVQLASVHPRWCAVNPADLQQARIKGTQRPRSAISVSPHFLAGIFSVTRLSCERTLLGPTRWLKSIFTNHVGLCQFDVALNTLQLLD